MSTDRRPQLSELFHAALARDLSTRAAFLSEACQGDHALQSEVERLLAAHGDAGSFLEAPVGTPAAVRRLSPGASVGAYCITHFIGAGGMGDIYRARDARLGRDVAIKILPASAAADAERRTRFAREAHAIAALNHPNIVTIHSVEQSEDLHFLTMELVDGKTLRELITPGGLPVDRLLQIAIPLADAIGTAHAHGIIHRDLKPANVMVTPEGRVKVLDFGLAKLKAPEPVATSVTTMPAREITDDGRVLGTVAYMSPEQAEGRDVDPRTDIFSLGVLLFELATGRRPFTGDSNVSLLSSILKDVPPPVTELRPELPPELGRLIRRCLAKEPGRRYQSAIDLRNDLEDLRHDLESGVIAATAHVAAGATRSRPRRTVWLAGALIALVIFAGVAYLVWPRAADRPPPLLGPTRTTLQPPVGVQVAEQSSALILAISPDGRWVAFHGDSDDPKRRGLYLRLTSELGSRLVRVEGGSSPFFSPDSQWLGFWADNAIWKVPVASGQPVPICSVPDQLRGASWGDDGAIVFAASIADKTRMLWRVPATGGEPALITSPGPPGYFFPHVLPGSKAALVMLIQDQERTIAVVSLQTGAIIRRLFQGATPQFTRDGFLVFRWLETLYAAPFDLEQLNVAGESPQSVLTGVSYNLGGSDTSAFAVSRTGTLVYISPVPPVEDAELVWIDGQGWIGRVAEARQNYFSPALDPEGRRVAVQIEKSGERSLYVYTISDGSWVKRTTGLHTTGPIVWSSDGQWIVFTVRQTNVSPSLFRVRADVGEPERLTFKGSASSSFANAHDFANSIYRNILMFDRQVASGSVALMTLRLDPLGTPEPFLETQFNTRNGQISPDGRWVAYVSTEAGGQQILVRSFSSPNRGRWPAAADASRPKWSRDGRSLFFFRNKEIWSVPVISTATSVEFRAGAPKRVVRFDPLEVTAGAMSADPDRFLILNRPATERLLVYVPNFADEVKDAMRRSSTSAR